MTLERLILRNRSYRRFDASRPIEMDTLRYLVDMARQTPSASNRQPLKYILIADAAGCARLFPHLKWAAALKDWAGPAENERPTAYIIVVQDKSLSTTVGCDHGVACQTLLLAAVERGLGGCMLGAVDRDGIRTAFKIPDPFEILLVVALGIPAETCLLEDAKPGADVSYYRDSRGVHHVPKRSLDEVILKL